MSQLRTQIARLFKQVLNGRSLNQITPTLPNIIEDSRDRAFAQHCLFGVCRYYEPLSWQLSQLLSKPLKPKDQDIHALLLLGLYQLIYLNTAPHAAISESVEATRHLKKAWASKLVNAILRQAQRNNQQEKKNNEKKEQLPLSVRFQLPEWLILRLQKAWPTLWQNIAEQLHNQADMILRVNQRHPLAKTAQTLLSEHQIMFEPHPHIPYALRLKQACPIHQLPEFDSGLFSVQDVSAQLTASILPVKQDDHVLDACAAPGGKTAHLLEQHNIRMTAMDKDEQRAQKITETLDRLHLKANVLTLDATQTDTWPSEIKKTYDAILLDAPCSATGVIRRQPDIKLHRKDSDIQRLKKQQQQLLSALWPLLKPHGYLLYATCSILPDENQQQIESFLKQTTNAQLIPITLPWTDTNITDTKYGTQLFPTSWHDGFFYALLKKTSSNH